ncbi:hypothetical protein CK203_053442 [Vitis vinifera]|uniref:DUF659 domain-containing protein n=1 Tax=Vitis vinifera TaxID=29760 RepID=A0A438GZD1_VITVI|nr:hypothetical protein CK203_053442 [Vitis vinifera]
MASEGGSAVPGRDPAWKYCSPIEGKQTQIGRVFYWYTVDDAKITEYATFASFTPYCPFALQVFCSKTKNIKDIFKGGAIKETMGRLISKFFIYESVAPAKAKSHHFKNMIIGAQQAGMGIEPPSPYEIKNKYLEMEYKEMEAYGKQLMKKYNLYWTPCAAHCIDLIFEDIAQMRKYCGGDIVRPGATSCSHNAICVRAYARDEENLIRQGAGDWMFKIIQDRWQKTLKHPLHAAGVELVVIRNYFKLSMMFLPKLDPTTESLGQFGNELVLFRDAKRGFGDRAAIASRSTMVPAEWWFMYGNQNTYIEKVSHQSSLTNCVIFCIRGGCEEEDNQLFQWVRPIHLDDEVGNPDPRIAAHAREFELMLNVCCPKKFTLKVLAKILMILFMRHIPSKRLTPQVLAIVVDLVLQDEDHGSRRAGPGIGAIGRPYRGRERMMEPYNEELLSGSFESMSIGTQFSDSSNEANVYPPHVMSYGQPSSSTDEEYGMSHYSPSRQMPYQIPYQMEEGFGVNTWVNFEYPIHVEAVGRTQRYMHGMLEFITNIIDSLTWYQYCLQQQAGVPSSINPIEPHRNSFWY